MNRKDLTILGILIGLAIGFTIGALCSWNGPAPIEIVIIMTILSLILVILLLRNKWIFSNDCKHDWTFWKV